MFKWAKHIEDKTDIPGEYLSGQEMIDLSCVDGTGESEYLKYFEEFSYLDDMIEDLKQHESSEIKNEKLPDDRAKKMNLREMEVYIEKCSHVLSKQIKKLASDAQHSISIIKDYNENLSNCLKKLLTPDFEIKLEKEEKLYRLIYYIYFGKKSGTGDSIAQLIKILEKKKTKELRGAGEEQLYKYIMALRKQLRLAESVYIVASDCNDFDNEKNLSEIL